MADDGVNQFARGRRWGAALASIDAAKDSILHAHGAAALPADLAREVAEMHDRLAGLSQRAWQAYEAERQPRRPSRHKPKPKPHPSPARP